jgi:hypothetical protein
MARPERHSTQPPRAAPEGEEEGRLLPFERSPLLHPRAGEALSLAASPYPGERVNRSRRGRPGWLGRLRRAILG